MVPQLYHTGFHQVWSPLFIPQRTERWTCYPNGGNMNYVVVRLKAVPEHRASWRANTPRWPPNYITPACTRCDAHSLYRQRVERWTCCPHGGNMNYVVTRLKAVQEHRASWGANTPRWPTNLHHTGFHRVWRPLNVLQASWTLNMNDHELRRGPTYISTKSIGQVGKPCNQSSSV